MSIVLALSAPNLKKIESQTINFSHGMENRKPVVRRSHGGGRSVRRIHGGGAATAAALVYKVSDISDCLCDSNLLKLRGCAMISKGIVVVEGEIGDIRRHLKRMKEEKIIWKGKIPKSSFGKFSVLHCSGESAVRKFFADHGASLYWDLISTSNLNS